MNTKLLIILIIAVVVSGCTTVPKPELKLDQPEVKINPFELGALKIWNSQNLEVNTITIDECNTAKRVGTDGVTWQLTLKSC